MTCSGEKSRMPEGTEGFDIVRKDKREFKKFITYF